jgi:hypothetical protein
MQFEVTGYGAHSVEIPVDDDHRTLAFRVLPATPPPA